MAGITFPMIVYLLCLATSVACAVLLARSFARTRARLLLWSSLCHLLSGIVIMGDLVASLFFLRFWRRSADPLFAVFSAAFLILAVGQLLLALTNYTVEERSWIYLLRLLAFSLIIIGILQKNRRSGH